MPFDNDAARSELLRILGTPRQALLLVGSGSSMFVKYPSWSKLVDGLRLRVVHEHEFPDGLDLLQKASFIKAAIEGFPDAEARRRLYRDYLEQTFGPRRDGPNHVALHTTLTQLPFCGIVTTNYDPVLESAITATRVERQKGACQTIDLCANHRHRVFPFLRGLSGNGEIDSVLHLHGFWDNPDGLILTGEDYGDRYFSVDSGEAAEGPFVAHARPLNTFHRKVVWALLTMRPVVFVGFGVEDPAFVTMLKFVSQDFALAPNPPAHIAVLPSDPREDGQRERDANRLREYGVLPVFYDLTFDRDDVPSYDALVTLIEELAASVGSPVTPGISTLTRKLLKK